MMAAFTPRPSRRLSLSVGTSIPDFGALLSEDDGVKNESSSSSDHNHNKNNSTRKNNQKSMIPNDATSEDQDNTCLFRGKSEQDDSCPSIWFPFLDSTSSTNSIHDSQEGGDDEFGQRYAE